MWIIHNWLNITMKFETVFFFFDKYWILFIIGTQKDVWDLRVKRRRWYHRAFHRKRRQNASFWDRGFFRAEENVNGGETPASSSTLLSGLQFTGGVL